MVLLSVSPVIAAICTTPAVLLQILVLVMIEDLIRPTLNHTRLFIDIPSSLLFSQLTHDTTFKLPPMNS